MPGPMASAASVDGANEPTASPRDVDANDSSVSTPQNFANLPHKQVASGLSNAAAFKRVYNSYDTCDSTRLQESRSCLSKSTRHADDFLHSWCECVMHNLN